MADATAVRSEQPGWLATLEQALTTAKGIVVTGCTRDLIQGHMLGLGREGGRWLPLTTFLQRFLLSRGYEIVATVDMVGEPVADTEEEVGRRYMRLAEPGMTALLTEIGAPPQNPTETFDVRLYLADLEVVLANSTHPAAVVVNHADKLFLQPERQQEKDRLTAAHLQRVLEMGARAGEATRNNVLLMVFPTDRDLPVDLLSNNPVVSVVTIPKPDKSTRRLFWSENIEDFAPYQARPDKSKNADDWADTMADHTDGFFIRELASLVEVSNDMGIDKQTRENPSELIHAFRFGRRRSPWEAINPGKIMDEGAGLSAQLRKRIKGQEKPIEQVRRMLLRAQTGIAGWQNPAKPKGIFFFVGPTGVGKTEMAKGLASFLFGSDDAMIRFDMSEYSQEHAGDRLVGAPPGYVGFERGGQLINAVREKPFSVLLFDEIEKGHQRTLDKFLQVLDDGRLTDGRGVTAYFSDTVIIFTSNIGQVHRDPIDKDTPPDLRRAIEAFNREIKAFIDKAPYSKDDVQPVGPVLDKDIYGREFSNLEEYFKFAVEAFFRDRLQRPELLRRVGTNNIIVFNRITDDIKRSIVVDKLKKLGDHLVKRGRALRVEFAPEVYDMIANHPDGFDKGGAGGMLNLISEYIEEPMALAVGHRESEFLGRTMKVSLVRGQVQVEAE